MGILGDWLPEDPQQNAAARQGLLALGGAMMSAKGNNFLGTLGQGLLAGGEGYQGALAQQQQAAYRQAQMQQMGLENQQREAALARPGRIAGIFKNRMSRPDPAIIKQSPNAAPAIRPISDLPQKSQQPEIQPDAPSSAALPAALPPAQMEALYRQLSHDYAEIGEMDLAKEYQGYAENQKRRLMKRETLIDRATNKPVSVLTYEDGEESASAYDALPDNQVVDLGDRQQIVDRNMPRDGTQYRTGVSPNAAVTANATREVAAATRDAARIQRDQATEMKLADDYRNQSKGFKEVSDAYKQINATLDKASTSPAATLAGATKFMKLLDPGSVVRESELGMALAATGVFDRATNYFETLKYGRVLTPAQVKDFKNITQQVYQAAQEGQRAVDSNYSNQAKTYGLRKDMIIQDLGQNAPPPGAPNANIPAGAANMLRSNPGLRAQFDAKYGAGAAASILGK